MVLYVYLAQRGESRQVTNLTDSLTDWQTK
jgi:hypothetical protein